MCKILKHYVNNISCNLLLLSNMSVSRERACQSPFLSLTLYNRDDGFVSRGHPTACKHIQYESLHQHSIFFSHIPPSLTQQTYSNYSRDCSFVLFVFQQDSQRGELIR